MPPYHVLATYLKILFYSQHTELYKVNILQRKLLLMLLPTTISYFKFMVLQLHGVYHTVFEITGHEYVTGFPGFHIHMILSAVTYCHVKLLT